MGNKLWKDKYTGKPMEDKDCFSKVCYEDSSQCCLWADKNLEFSPMIKNHPSPPDRERTERVFFCVSVSFHVPLAQNNLYVRVSYFHSPFEILSLYIKNHVGS